MVTPELINYIKIQQQNGLNLSTIISTLASSGWQDNDIQMAISQINSQNLNQNLNENIPPDYDKKSNTNNVIIIDDSLGFSDFLSLSFRIFKKVWKLLIIINFITVLLYIPFRFWVNNFSQITKFNNLVTPEQITKLFYNSIPIIIASILVAPIILLVTTLMQMHIVNKHEENINLKEIFYTSLSQLFSFAWINILYCLIFLGGLLLFIIPGIYLGISFMFFGFSLVIDGKRGLSALINSKNLLKNKIIFVIKYLFVIFIINITLQILSSFIIFPIKLLVSMLNNSVLNILQDIVITFPTNIITSFSIVMNYVLYKMLKNSSTNTIEQKVNKWPYILLFIFGLSLPLLTLISGIIFTYTINPLSKFNISSSFQAENDLIKVRNALLIWGVEKGTYPITLKELVPKYMEKIPINNVTGNEFYYEITKNGADFQLCYSENNICSTSTEANVLNLPKPITN